MAQGKIIIMMMVLLVFVTAVTMAHSYQEAVGGAGFLDWSQFSLRQLLNLMVKKHTNFHW